MCLLHTPYLKQFFRVLYDSDGKKQKIAKEMQYLFNSDPNVSVVRPQGFKKTVSKEIPEFAGFDQCDAQEFLTFLFNHLNEDLTRT